MGMTRSRPPRSSARANSLTVAMARPSNGYDVVEARSFAYSPPPASMLQEVSLRQLTEDLSAYRYDLDYCSRQLSDMGASLTGPESRTFQLRVLDLGHQIRHCEHKLELLHIEMRSAAASGGGGASYFPANWTQPCQHRPANSSNHSNGNLQHQRQQQQQQREEREHHEAREEREQREQQDQQRQRENQQQPQQQYEHKKPHQQQVFLPELTQHPYLPQPPQVPQLLQPPQPQPPQLEQSELELQEKQQPQDYLIRDHGSVQYRRPNSAKRSPVADCEHDPTSSSSSKRVRPDEPLDEEAHSAVQRLGFWNCRLCTSEKYLSAGLGRLPGAPCKWPLRDVAKMITHFTELHTEHKPAERCVELGDALDRNRGPFEHWLRHSHSQNLRDGSVIADCLDGLHAGLMPPLLRELSRAASRFPQDWHP